MRALQDRASKEIFVFSMNLFEGEKIFEVSDNGNILVLCHGNCDGVTPASMNGHLIPREVEFDVTNMHHVGSVRGRELFIEVIPPK